MLHHQLTCSKWGAAHWLDCIAFPKPMQSCVFLLSSLPSFLLTCLLTYLLTSFFLTYLHTYIITLHTLHYIQYRQDSTVQYVQYRQTVSTVRTYVRTYLRYIYIRGHVTYVYIYIYIYCNDMIYIYIWYDTYLVDTYMQSI